MLAGGRPAFPIPDLQHLLQGMLLFMFIDHPDISGCINRKEICDECANFL